MFLEPERFRAVVACTPLVSIDLVVRRRSDGAILLGERLNRPAQAWWFVPGGRIQKNETLDAAFIRLTETELGTAFPRSRARPLGVYEHFYADSVFGEAPDTHYVVLGYVLELDDCENLEPPADQHGRYRWWWPSEIHDDAAVHENTRVYLEAL